MMTPHDLQTSCVNIAGTQNRCRCCGPAEETGNWARNAPERRIWFQACCAILKGLDNICCRGGSGPRPNGRQMLLLSVGRGAIFKWSRSTGRWGGRGMQQCKLCCLLSSRRWLTSQNSIRSQQNTLCGHLCINKCAVALLFQQPNEKE